MHDPSKAYQELIEENAILKQRIQELQKSEASYKMLFANAAEGILVAELQTKQFIYANPALCGMFGRTDEEILQLGVDDIHPKESLGHVMAEFDALAKGEKTWALNIPCLRKDGSLFYANISTTSTVVLDGKKCNVGFFTDITERKKVEDELRESENTCKFLTDNMSDIAWITDMNLRTLYVTPSIQKMLGFSLEERMLQTINEQLTPDSLARALDALANELALEEQGNVDPLRTLSLELEFYHKDGSTRWLDVIISGTRNDHGVSTGIHGVARDVTERKVAEDALKKSEAKYRELVENANSIILRMGRDGTIKFMNEFGQIFFGYTEKEIIGRHVIGTIVPETESTGRNLRILLDKICSDPKDYEQNTNENIRRNGERVFISWTNKPVLDKQGQLLEVLSIGSDITDRKRAEENISKSEKKFSSTFHLNPNPMAITDMGTGKLIDVNQAFIRWTGYAREEVIGTSTQNLHLWVNPEDRGKIIDALTTTGEVNGTEIMMRQRNGHVRIVLTSAQFIEIEQKRYLLTLVHDITERKQAEEENQRLAERLQRAEKMEALGQLAGGVAHDLNNVLGVLAGYSELLMDEIPEEHRARGHVEKILKSTEKGAAIIQDLLTLARRGVTSSEVINLNSIVSGFLNTPVFEKVKDYHPHVTFRVACQEALLNIKGSPIHLEKTLMNLVSNAAESISGKGEVTIRTDNRYLDKPIRGYDEAKEGDYATLTVSDTGTGIPAGDREKIFEPFYTKKTMGRSGTGLGLAIVWGTVKDHNGYLDLQTEAGVGTSFTLYFPVTREEMIAPQQKVPIEQYMGRGESVLVVDDIPEQRDVASGLLKKLGYEVHTVSSGEAAVEYLKGNKADILVLDMIMAPGIDGLETYERILEANPKQKAILVSGFSETDRVSKALQLGAGAYVRKPYLLETIGVAIRNELNR